jgi:hypothetical protein
MYVADTNNHRILAVKLADKSAAEFAIEGLAPPEQATTDSSVEASISPDEITSVKAMDLAIAESIGVNVDFKLPEGFKLNPLQPVKYKITAEGQQPLVAAEALKGRREAKSEEKSASFPIPTSAMAGEATLLISITYGYCRDGKGGVCKVGSANWKVAVTTSNNGMNKSIQLSTTGK